MVEVISVSSTSNIAWAVCEELISKFSIIKTRLDTYKLRVKNYWSWKLWFSPQFPKSLNYIDLK